jgi:CheY-like chemotaxis protein
MSKPEPDPRPVVLLVEDEPLVRMFNADVLDEAGFRAIEAVNADEAVALIEARPDIRGSTQGLCNKPRQTGQTRNDTIPTRSTF